MLLSIGNQVSGPGPAHRSASSGLIGAKRSQWGGEYPRPIGPLVCLFFGVVVIHDLIVGIVVLTALLCVGAGAGLGAAGLGPNYPRLAQPGQSALYIQLTAKHRETPTTEEKGQEET